MHPLIRHGSTALLLLNAPLPLHAMGRKETCTIRFYVEVDAASADPFTIPVRVGNPPRHIFHESGASLSERQIIGAYTYQKPSGEWAALFKLDPAGQLTLNNISSANRGRSLIAYLGDAKVARFMANDILIDRVISDGMIQVTGLFPKEVILIQKHFPQLKPATEQR
jgi:hypothetical protein